MKILNTIYVSLSEATKDLTNVEETYSRVWWGGGGGILHPSFGVDLISTGFM